MIARRDWTRRWFDAAVKTDRIVTSAAVLSELENGNFPSREQAIRLLDDLELLAINHAISEIVDAYAKHKLMPKDPFGDALHLALASYHRCDFLVTWNCQHLANAKKFGHIRRVNGILGLFVPELVTPMELLGEDWNL
jgi:predicted nucleic acid-binding protein